MNVKITVTDANDNVPVFDSLHYPANVRLDNEAGDTLVVVKATDADSGVLGEVSYTIVSGDPDNYFRVDALSGQPEYIYYHYNDIHSCSHVS